MDDRMTENTFWNKVFTIQQRAKATKDKQNNFGNYSYRSAEGIIEDIKPVLRELKAFILLSDNMREVGGRVYVEATATLYDAESDGKIEAKALAREAETKKGMDEAQITGAASSYARKYALSGLLLLDDNKDADTDEYYVRTQESAKSEPKKSTSKTKAKPAAEKTAEPVPVISLVCADCGSQITDYKGQPAKSIATATFNKYGASICMKCSCKRRGVPFEEEEQAQPAPTPEEDEVPFDLYEYYE